MMFIPSFMKLHQLFQNILGQYNTRTLLYYKQTFLRMKIIQVKVQCSEMLVSYRNTIQHHNPEDLYLNLHRRKR